MATDVRVEVEDGRAVVRTRAMGHDAPLLEAAAARLREAAHPGVVPVVRAGPVAGGFELVTVHAGTSWAARPPAEPRGVAAPAADLASTLADLHERGIVHGRVDARHVLLGGDGRAVLVGFGRAAPEGAGPVDDVAAVGRLVLARLGPADAPALRAAALAAVDDEPARRPSARRLALQLRTLADPAPAPAGRRRRPRLVAVALAAALAAGAALVVGVSPSRPGVTDRPSTPARDARTPGVVRAPRCVAAAGTRLRATECGHDVVVEGARVTVDGQVHVVGREGDEVAVARWHCASEPQAAVLRPATGQLLVVAGLDEPGATSVVTAEQVAPGRHLAPRVDEHGCPSVATASAR